MPAGPIWGEVFPVWDFFAVFSYTLCGNSSCMKRMFPPMGVFFYAYFMVFC